jgi:hypothetical protein
MVGYINIFDGAMRTGFYAFFAAFAILLVVNADVPMWTHFKFSQHLIRTNIQTIPTGIAITRSDLYIFGDRMTQKRIVEFHLMFLILQRKVVVFVRARNDPPPPSPPACFATLPNKRGGEKKKVV